MIEMRYLNSISILLRNVEFFFVLLHCYLLRVTDCIHKCFQARSRAEAVVRAAAAAEQLQQLEIQMEDSGEMVEPVGSGKVYARAEGEEQSEKPATSSFALYHVHTM